MHSVVPPPVAKIIFVLVNETVSWECSQMHLIYTSTCIATVGNRHSFQSCKSPEELNEIQLYVNV